MSRTHRFPTPAPIALDLRIHRGAVTVIATDTGETTVEVTGRHADGLRVDCSTDGRRIVVAPTRHAFGRHHVDVAVRLPTRSTLRLAAAAGQVEVTGVVGETSISCASGGIRVEEVDGRVELRTASADARLGTVRGPLDAHTASGSLEVGHLAGDGSIRSASGSVEIGTADGDVQARTASGRVRIREAHRGTVDASSTSGGVVVGVRQGTLVWLDVTSTTGRVDSDLAADEPGDADGPPLTVRARTVSGRVSVATAGPAPIAL